MTREAELRGLERLAGLWGVYPRYTDGLQQRRRPSPEALVAVLRALGAPLTGEGLGGVGDALVERELRRWRRPLDPVAIAWDEGPADVAVRVPERLAGDPVRCVLSLEEGPERGWTVALGDAPAGESGEADGESFVTRHLVLPAPIPFGYHRLSVEVGGRRSESLVISAPTRAPAGERTWGVFAPLYAVASERSWGFGDFTDLETLIEWTASLGGRVVATLPLLAQFLDEPFEPSPYSPASRLFWNELFLDLERAPELTRCEEARTLLSSTPLQKEVDALRRADTVDYRRAFALKRQVIEALASCFFESSSSRRDELWASVAASASLDEYARFRAETERLRAPWTAWGGPAASGTLGPDTDEGARRYHLYAQWLAREQMLALGRHAHDLGSGLYLDLPLGVHAAGYDVWRERDAFASGVAGGAPPDSFFLSGQNWAFRPLHPERIRDQGYRYPIECLRHLLTAATVLRIDHVMGLHRLFWVPDGMEASEGTYVRYPAEELWAVLTLEAHREGAIVVGEDLGTVPREVRRAMSRHRIQRSYVVQEEATDDAAAALNPVPRESLASVNTHDMPPWAAFWEGRDVAERLEQGLFDSGAAAAERERRERVRGAIAATLRREGSLPGDAAEGALEVLHANLRRLAASPARTVVATLEDLWLEDRRQNMPGTGVEAGNWSRKARFGLEELRERPEVLEPLREIDRLRRGEGERS